MYTRGMIGVIACMADADGAYGSVCRGTRLTVTQSYMDQDCLRVAG